MRASAILRNTMLLLSERDVRKALNLKECLEINKQALKSLTEKTGVVPSRLALSYPNNPNDNNDNNSQAKAQDWTLIKPAAYYPTTATTTTTNDDDTLNKNDSIAMGMKVVSVRANNPKKGLPLVPATIFLVDAQSGMVQSTISGTYITVARTSAGPAIAVETFQPHLQHLVIFGAGAQAACHIELMEIAIGNRAIPKITIINRSIENAEALKKKIETTTSNSNCNNNNRDIEVIALSDTEGIARALSTADVVSATTNTATPLWNNDDATQKLIKLKKGCLITGIGSYTPDMSEIPEYIVNQSHVIIDTPEAMEVGDLKHLGTYEPTNTHPITLAGNALSNPTDIGKTKDYIFYKAVGTAIQDVLTAQTVVQKAKELGIGQEIDMS